MAQVTTSLEVRSTPGSGFGVTERKDAWWASPLATLVGILIFVIYANVATFQGTYFEIRENRADFYAPGNEAVAPYLTPFYSPLLYDAQSHHAWIKEARPSWWPGWVPFSAALLILPIPLSFRFTCYYYRKAYYRSFWASPVNCAVGKPQKGYLGENHLPLILQNIHRYALYLALFFLLFLWWDVIVAFWWPTLNAEGHPTGGHQLGMGLGTLLMLVNVTLLTGFTFGCNSLRHLVGGGKDCFSCPNNLEQTTTGYKLWRGVTWFNLRHSLWAWLSLYSVGLTDLYIRLCAMGWFNDVRFF